MFDNWKKLQYHFKFKLLIFITRKKNILMCKRGIQSSLEVVQHWQPEMVLTGVCLCLYVCSDAQSNHNENYTDTLINNIDTLRRSLQKCSSKLWESKKTETKEKEWEPKETKGKQ